MVSEQEVIEHCRLIVAQTGKRPTVRAVLADGTIRGDRSKIAKIVSQFNQSEEQQPNRIAVAPEIKEAWENALKGLTETVSKLLEAQGAKIGEDKSDALLVAFDAADEAFAYAEQMEVKVEEVESKLAKLREELVAVRTSTSTQQEDTERRLRELTEKAESANKKANQEIEAYKTQIFELQTELQQSLHDREAKIKTIEAENTELRIRATAGEAALQSKAEELTRFIQERERIDVLHREESKALQDKISVLQSEMQGLGAAKSTASAEAKRADKAEAKIQEIERLYFEQVQLVADLRAQLNAKSAAVAQEELPLREKQKAEAKKI